jgi:hypothetical protein
MASLYSTYYARFPHHNFWQMLSESKQKNQQIIRSVSFVTDPCSEHITADLYKSSAIKTQLDWISSLLKKADDHSMVHAICYSLDLEQAKIEQKYFDCIKDCSKQIQDILPLIIEKNQYDIDLLEHKLTRAKERQSNTLNFITQLEKN